VIQVLVKRQYVLLTTLRRPTKDMRTLCRDIAHTFPNIVRINRGKLSLEGVAEKALELDVEKVMIIEGWKRGQVKLRLFDVSRDGLDVIPPIICVSGGVKFRRDFGEQMLKRRRIKSVALATFPKENHETRKLENVLSDFFGVPTLPLEEAVNGKNNAVMQILTDSLNRIAITLKLTPELVEIGPRIGISHLVWELTR